jgi:hypothetical protein
MDGEYTTRPTTRPITSHVITDPPLIRFDGDDVQNFFSSCGDRIDRWRGLVGKISDPSFANGLHNSGCLRVCTRFISVPTWNRWIAVPKVNKVPTLPLADFLA